MSQPDPFAYSYDEERLGFAEPARAEPKEVSTSARIATGLIALGALVLVLCLGGAPLRGTWAGLLASFGLMAAGACWLIWSNFAGTLPGIKHDDTFFRGIQNRGLLGWMAGVFMTGFYVVLYFYADLQARGMPALLDPAARVLDPLSRVLSGKPADQWFLYGFLYTALILVFGLRMLLKYRHNRYQQVRTASVMTAQLGFAFLLPNVLKSLSQPEFYATYFWPLKTWYGEPDGAHSFWSSGNAGQIMILFSAAMLLVATPVLTYFYGKRWYCSFVCGCGGLAETLGDPWRQQSDKSERAWKIERWTIHLVLVWVVTSTALLWFNSWKQGQFLGAWSSPYAKTYGLVIGSIFSGVVGVGFYPLLGTRVWCRFGCPMAAILGLLQRCFSRFRITTNGAQCMSCGNCSTYCEMGIDVRAYAQRGENIVRASCVGCGVCSAVCPRGVLKLENGSTHADRHTLAADPLATFLDSLKRAEQHRN